jgi:hypothetical protein
MVRGPVTCQWNPKTNRRAERGAKTTHTAVARVMAYDEAGNLIKLCKRCAKLPRFKDTVVVAQFVAAATAQH